MLGMFSKSKPMIGLDIGSSSVKAVELAKVKGGYEVVGFAQTPLGADLIVDGAITDSAAVSEVIKLVFTMGKFKARNVATGVAGNAVIVKRVSLPVDTPEEVAGSIEFDADKYIPFDISEVNLDYQIVGAAEGDEGGLEVVLVAAKKEQVANSTEVVTMAGRVPTVVDVDAFALQNAFEANYSPSPADAIALLNIGASRTNINIVKAGMPLFVRDVSVGGDQYTDILQKELQLSLEEAEDLKFGKQVGMYDADMVAPLLDSITDMLIMEVQKTFDFFRENDPDETIKAIYLAGGGSRATGIADKVQAAFGIETEMLDPLKSVRVGSKAGGSVHESGPALAIALGLAMRGFDG